MIEEQRAEIVAKEQIITHPTIPGAKRATTIEAFETWLRNSGTKFPVAVTVSGGLPEKLNSANDLARVHKVVMTELERKGYLDFHSE